MYKTQKLLYTHCCNFETPWVKYSKLKIWAQSVQPFDVYCTQRTDREKDKHSDKQSIYIEGAKIYVCKTQWILEAIHPPLSHPIQDRVNFAIKIYFLKPSCIYLYPSCIYLPCSILYLPLSILYLPLSTLYLPLFILYLP